jgi:glycosyltransferase involved in cell wall biosynthesis
MKILIISHEYPRPDIAASNRRLVDLLKIIAREHDVDLHCPSQTRSLVRPHYEDLYRSIGIRIIFGDAAGLQRRILRRQYHVALCEWWITAPKAMSTIRRLQPWMTVVIDAVDVCFRREEAALKLGRMDPGKVAENRLREIQSYLSADAVLAVTEEDKAALRTCGVTAPIFFVPMIESINPRTVRNRDRDLLFVGTFGINPANVDGVLWFADAVWPHVRQAVPDAQLTLVGSNPPPDIENLARIPGIQVAGFVADLTPYLTRAAVSIAPLRFGGGMKGKVTEAMAHGIPVVTTSFGVQGLDVTNGEHLVVADDAHDFARGVIELLRDVDHAESIGLAGQRFIAGICSPEVVENRVQEFLTWVESRQRHPSWASSLKWTTQSLLDRTACALIPSGGRKAIAKLSKRVTDRRIVLSAPSKSGRTPAN